MLIDLIIRMTDLYFFALAVAACFEVVSLYEDSMINLKMIRRIVYIKVI